MGESRGLPSKFYFDSLLLGRSIKRIESTIDNLENGYYVY